MARLTKSLIKKYNSYLYMPEPTDYYSCTKKTVKEYVADGGELGAAIITAYKKRDVIVIIDCGHGRSTAGKKSPWSMHGVYPAIPFEE